MKRWLRHHSCAQATPLVLMALVTCVGAVALVVDAGVFFVTDRQLQTAADAAALAAAAYPPVCQTVDPNCGALPVPAPIPGWGDTECGTPAPEAPADCVADAVAVRNLGYAGALCRSVAAEAPRLPPIPANHLQPYVMAINCEAPYWFARVFPGIPATMHIKAHAVSTWGWRTPTSDAGPPPQPTPAPPRSPYVIRILE